MNADVPAIFQQSIAEHNRHCWVSAILSWLGAFVGWLLFTAVYVGFILLVETMRTGDATIGAPPSWMIPVGCGLAVGMLIFAAVDRWRRRFRPASDRPIIGWHLLPEVLLLPARLTFAIWDYLGARLKPTPWELTESWRLLEMIVQHKRVAASTFGQEFGDPVLLPKLITILQYTGWIDTARGEEDWFYYVPSDQLPRLQGQ